MKLDVTDCEVLSLDSGVIDCPVTQKKLPVLFMTVRITGQGVVNTLRSRMEKLGITVERPNAT